MSVPHPDMSDAPKILVVDDDPASVQALSALLDGLGPTVMTATSGVEALRQVLEHEFALILLDVKMPGLDGFETAALIRSRKKSYRTPIVFLTGKSAEDSYVFKGYEVGAVDYMVKPVVPEVLRSKVTIFVDLYRKNMEITYQREELRKAAKASAKRFYDLVQGLDAIVWECDAVEYQFTFVSQQAESMLGYEIEDWLADKNFLSKIIHPDDLQQAMAAYTRTLELADGQEVIYRARRADHSYIWVRDTVRVLRDERGRPLQLRGVMVDVTAHKEAEHRLAQIAHYDALTGLPNRHLLEHRLRDIMARRPLAGQEMSAVLFLDLDRFKFINDTMGHDVGDALLRSIAKRLRGCVREHDMIARLGGDEFIAIVDRISSREEAAAVAEKILARLALPVAVAGEEIFVTCSIGVSIHPEDGSDAETLVKNADVAMYVAKELGKNTYQFYRAEMHRDLRARQELEQALHQALQREEFELHYQPQYNLANGAVSGCEALIRWRRPGVGTVKPQDFISVLEETGLIVQVGEWALRSACEQLKQWHAEGRRPPRVSVNLSRLQLKQDGILARIKSIVAETGVDPAWLELEVTESMVMENVERAAQILRQLGDMGIAITIDDFGTGHSSLSALKHLPIHGLKIDQSFVRDLPGEDDACIAVAIVSMAKSLGMRVIAEGVENRAQVQLLREQGCDDGQGNFLCPARPAHQFTGDVPAVSARDRNTSLAGSSERCRQKL